MIIKLVFGILPKMTTENYIYMGHQQDTYFFLHTIFNKKKFTQSSYSLNNQLMTYMINTNMITCVNKKIIIYTSDGVNIYVNSIQHVRGEKETYDQINLGFQMKRCINHVLSARGNTQKMLVFCYHYHDKLFETFFIDLDVSSLLPPLDKRGIDISDINYYTNYKSIRS